MAISFADDFDAKRQRALIRLALWFSARCSEEIRTPKWEALTPPRIRDIVDSGKLLNSQGITIDPDGSFTVNWGVDYALEVHEGSYTTGGQRILARRWTEEPLAELPDKFAEFLAQEFALNPV